ncbi:MAG TPA: TlpA disulfide reductase family protein [Candidatus Acidoferrales bacterium]|nr:TlpA disulfide reductase family protein [Candidatus Acidoferrales bacterium]
MPRLGRRSLSIAALALLLGTLGFPRPRSVAAKPAPNAEAGDPQLLDLAGYRDMVAGYRGKGVLVTFWATWCEPCRNEYPMIISLAKEYGPQGLAVVGVSLDEDADMNLVRHFLAQSHPGFPNYRQKPGIDADAFYQGVNPEWRGAMPETVFYGRDGHLARFFVGEKSHEAFVDAIRLILVTPGARLLPNDNPIAGQ